MIQLKAVPPPSELTPSVVAELTAKFKEDSTSVWNKDYIKKALLDMTDYKCAYSEIKLQEEGKYMEVEHFLPKNPHADKVVEWDNLLPASKFCNVKKGDKPHPIVHPVRDAPNEHLYMVDYAIYGRTEKGKNSVIVLGLNDEEHLLKPRREIRFATQNELQKQFWRVKSFETNPTIELEIAHALENLMKQGKRKEPYSATVATTILNDSHYLEIKQIFKSYNLWTAEFEDLETELKYCALATKP
jgi:hypothetical protein